MTVASFQAPARFDELTGRLERARRAVREAQLAACVVTLPENVHYLSGHAPDRTGRLQAVIVPARGTPVVVVPAGEPESDGCPALERLTYEGHDGSALLTQALARADLRGGRVGIEQRHPFLTVRMYKTVAAQFRDVEWVDNFGMIEEARLLKSPTEEVRLRHAGMAASAGMEAGVAMATAGGTENDVAAGVFRGMLKAGSEFPGSPPYITCGSRTALPFATWEGAPLAPGRVLLVEHAASVGRYHAAIMRTFCFGTPTADQRDASAIVVAALERMIQLIRPGVPAADVNEGCREVLLRAGDDSARVSGYSIGLAYPPGWNEAYMFALARHNDRVVQERMALYLLPSLQVGEEFTVGCGDTVWVTSTGCEVLTPYPRPLFALPTAG